MKKISWSATYRGWIGAKKVLNCSRSRITNLAYSKLFEHQKLDHQHMFDHFLKKFFLIFIRKKRENFRMAFNRKMPTLYKNFIKPLLSHFCFFQRCPVEFSTAEERSHFITKILWSFAKSVEVRVSKLQTHFSQNLLIIVDKLFFSSYTCLSQYLHLTVNPDFFHSNFE